MAIKLGRDAFSVGEAVNGRCFNDWNFENILFDTYSIEFTDDTCDYNNGQTINHDANANIVTGLQVFGTGINAAYDPYIVVQNSTSFKIYGANGADLDTTGGAVTNGTLTFKGGTQTVSSTYITSSNPAKKVMIYPTPGFYTRFGEQLQDIDIVDITINENTDTEKKIPVDSEKFKTSISGRAEWKSFILLEGLLINSLSVTLTHVTEGNRLSVLSFH